MYLYLCKMADPVSGEEFHKVGVSRTPSIRFKWGETKVTDSGMALGEMLENLRAGQHYVSDHPYEYEILHVVQFRFEGEALLRERDLLASLKRLKYRPDRKFSGWTECIRCDDATRELIIQCMDAAAADAKENEISELSYSLAAVGVRETEKIARHLKTLENHRKTQG